MSVTPLDANSVRVNIQATGKAPSGTVTSYGDRVILAINNSDQPSQSATPVPAQIATVPGASVPSQPLAQNTPAPKPEVLVPNPQVTIDGKPVTRPNQVPPLLPRAVAPPVGDIAIAESRVLSDSINLGSNQRIPKLLLRDAPAREVLSLLARAAGLNVIFAESPKATRSEEHTSELQSQFRIRMPSSA